MKHFLTLLAIVKNERPEYVAEWRAHHAALGVEHTYLLEHVPNELPLPAMPDTTAWPVGPERAQTRFYFEAMQYIDAEWCIVIDADEFIVANDLCGMLARCPADALALNWLLFGSSGHDEPISPVHGSYQWRTPCEHGGNRHVKSIVRPRAIRWPPPDPHFWGCHTVNERGEQLSGPLHVYSGAQARVNHYFTRSRADWASKLARGRADCEAVRAWDEFEAINRESVVEDEQPCKIWN